MTLVTRRVAMAGGATLASSAGLVACGKGDETDTSEAIASPEDNVVTDTSDPKIVKEKTSVSFLSGRFQTTLEDWNEVECVKAAEKATNLHVDFGVVPLDGLDEKRNLALSSGDYPEAFYRNSISAGDLAKYAGQGTFIAVDDLIDKYMPNLKKIMDEDDDVRKGVTLPDGHIYSFPGITDKDFMGMRIKNKLWVRQDWLDEFGMDVPETLDEYEEYLKSCVNDDPRGDGGKDIIGIAGGGIGQTFDSFLGTFGVALQGTDAGNIDLDPDTGKIRYFPMSEGYRDLLTYLNSLYSQGLVQQDIFATDDAKRNTLGRQGVVGSVALETPAGFFGEEGENYVALPPLKKNTNDGVPSWNAIGSAIQGIGQFVLTDKCEHPVEIARWADFWYGEEGARLFFLGIEGESYEEKDGRLELTPEVTAGGKSIDEGLKPYVLYLGGRYPAVNDERWFRGVEGTPQALAGSEMLGEYAVDDVWPPFTFTDEESETLSSIGTDIDKHLDESKAAFITGKKKMSEWDDYVSKFDQIGIDEYLGVYQAALDRRS
jgi:putative aldouronate transport system substrate-binding protein